VFLIISMTNAGKILIATGAVLIIAGLILCFGGHKMTWIGRLPGDIRIEKENLRFYFPVTTMIILSVVVSLIIWIARKLF